MRPARSRLLGVLVFVTGVIVALAGVPIAIADNRAVPNFLDPVALLFILIGLLWLATGATIVSRQPGNWAGWIFCTIGLMIPLALFAQSYAVYTLKTNPGSLPLTGVAALIAEYGFYAIALIPLLFLLFPDGHPPGKNWRWAGFGLMAGTAMALVGFILRPETYNNLRSFGISYENPLGVEVMHDISGKVIGAGTILALVSACFCVLGLRSRYKRSAGEERQRLRWLVFVASIGGLLLVIAFAFGLLGELIVGGAADENGAPVFPILLGLAVLVLALGIPVSYLVAIFRHGLWDLEVVIKKALVAAVLVLMMTLTALLILATLGQFALWRATPKGISVAVGLAVGLLFLPLLRVSRRLADRVVYGRRASPYEVLTEFSGRVAETYAAEEVLPQMAEVLAQGAGADSAAVWLRVGGELRPAAVWPPGSEPTRQHSIQVRHLGEALGELSVSMPASEPMNPSKQKLVEDLASQAGLVLRNVRLIEELRDSRRRIVTAQDERAKKLERDLHDGAQQQLVALTVKLKLAQSVVTKEPEKAEELLSQVHGEAQDSLETLRDLARGIYPPLLADKGLVAAIEAQARKSAVPVEVESDGVGRYPQEIEAAVYFSCLEALQNVTKYANASRASVRLAADEGSLVFRVEDDGKGFDPSDIGFGTGLQGITDRIETLGGSLKIESHAGRGTRVSGRLPVEAAP